MISEPNGETRIGRVTQENGALPPSSSDNALRWVQFLDARGQPDGAPQACRNIIGADADDLVVVCDACIVAVAQSVRVLAREEMGRAVRRA